MSADSKLEVQARTDNGPVTSMFMRWAALVRERPGVKVSREELIAAWKDDPQLAGAVEQVKREVPKGAMMWITDAGAGKDADGPIVTMTVRFG